MGVENNKLISESGLLLQGVAHAQTSATIDCIAQEKYNLSAEVLMELAGAKSADSILQYFSTLIAGKKSVVLLCGPGHNGGDGLVVARHLHSQGIKVQVFVADDIKSNLVKKQKNRLLLQNIPTYNLSDFNKIKKEIKETSLIIDALFGVGLKGEVRGGYVDLINYVNSLSSYVVSLDVPSGLNVDTGLCVGVGICANMTLTYGLTKLGFYLQEGPKHTGFVKVLSIGYPFNLVTQKNVVNSCVVTKKWVSSRMPKRKIASHKAQQGHVLVIAGSCGYEGAGQLCSEAALRMGCGYVTLATSSSLQKQKMLNSEKTKSKARTCGLPQSVKPLGFPHCGQIRTRFELVFSLFKMLLTKKITQQNLFSWVKKQDFRGERIAPDILTQDIDDSDLFKNKTAVAIGPGLEVGESTKQLLLKLKKLDLPVVVDASAFRVCVKEKLYPLPSHWVVTPHSGELAYLFKLKGSEIDKNKAYYATQAMQKLNCTLLLKGFHSVIAIPSTQTSEHFPYSLGVIPTGNSALAKAGTGDVLTGFIASLMARKVSPVEALAMGAFIHGALADEHLRTKGVADTLMAQDLKDLLPIVLNNTL